MFVLLFLIVRFGFQEGSSFVNLEIGDWSFISRGATQVNMLSNFVKYVVLVE